MWSLVADGVVAGLGQGAIYALLGVGYTLVLGASGVFNFAQGAIVMAGALTAFGLGTVIHVEILLLLAIVMATGAIGGLLAHTFAVLPLTHRSDVPNLTFGTFISTLGVFLTINAIIALAFGIQTYPVDSYVSLNPIKLGSVHIEPYYLVMIAAALVLVIVFETISRKTQVGLVMRATLADVEGTALAGVSINKAVRLVFMAGCSIAAVAGFLVLPITFASANIANQYAFYGFAAMGIGGFGSFFGAIAGGLLVGLVQNVPQVWISPNWSDPLIYLLMLVVLLFRPQGLFGSGGTAFGAAALRDV